MWRVFAYCQESVNDGTANRKAIFDIKVQSGLSRLFSSLFESKWLFLFATKMYSREWFSRVKINYDNFDNIRKYLKIK